MRLVVFDMDGTLIDSQAHITAVMFAAFAEQGLAPPTAEASRRVIGLALPEALGALSGQSGDALVRLVANYRSLYLSGIASQDGAEPLYAGAREALGQLASNDGTVLGIATGKAMRGVNRVLDLHGLAAMFSTLQTPDTNPSKPDPGMMLSAMAETGIGPDRAVVIGDTSFDMEMAKAAGALAIGVMWGYHERVDLKRAGADLIVDDYAALNGAIDELVKPDA